MKGVDVYKLYKPGVETEGILSKAWQYIQSAPYTVTARWVFYRLLQDGTLDKKADYKRLLGFLSKARKSFYQGWRPNTLGDETRGAVVRGGGFSHPERWLQAIKGQLTCDLDRWYDQDTYIEMWFEAAAMQGQFQHYTNGNIPLLAFHGDISIPEKWRAAARLYERWQEGDTRKKIVVLYYGDLDPKGIQIPDTAREDIAAFAADVARSYGGDWTENYIQFLISFTFMRVGINDDHPGLYDIPENPERPGTYQWEGLSDDGAQELIAYSESYLEPDKFEEVERQEQAASDKVREHLEDLDL